MHLNTSSRAEFFKIQFLDMKSNFCQRNKLQLKYFVQARFSNTGPFFWATRYSVNQEFLSRGFYVFAEPVNAYFEQSTKEGLMPSQEHDVFGLDSF